MRESAGSGYYINCGIETRQRLPFIEDEAPAIYQELSDGYHIESIRAFSSTKNTLSDRTAKTRKKLEQDWPNVSPMEIGAPNAYEPLKFLYRYQNEWYPSDGEKREAISKLPYMNRNCFTHQRMDSRYPVVFTFIRRGSYYAIFTSGQIVPVIYPTVPKTQQRYGLGLIWNPIMGTVFQTQTGSNDAAWGTITKGDKLVYEAESFDADFIIDNKPIKPLIGCHELSDGILIVEYPLGNKGKKKLMFVDDYIDVTLSHQGAFTEYIPLLKSESNVLNFGNEEIRLQQGKEYMNIIFDKSVNVDVLDVGHQSGLKKVACLCLSGIDKLRYRIAFSKK